MHLPDAGCGERVAGTAENLGGGCEGELGAWAVDIWRAFVPEATFEVATPDPGCQQRLILSFHCVYCGRRVMDKHSWGGCEFVIINTPRGVTTQDKVKLLRIMSVPWVGDLGLLQ